MRFFSILIILTTVLIDFFSKKFIENNLDANAIILNQFITLTKTYNKGIAFSMFDSASALTNIFFSIIVFFILLIIINIMSTKIIEGLSQVHNKYDAFFKDLWGVVHNGVK